MHSCFAHELTCWHECGTCLEVRDDSPVGVLQFEEHIVRMVINPSFHQLTQQQVLDELKGQSL